MRRLVWLAVVFALLWSGWWGFATYSLRSSFEAWFDARRAEGWQAEMVEIRSGGFPMALDTTLADPLLADPQTGVAFETEALRFSAPAWWPGYVTVTLPGDSFSIATPLHKRVVTVAEARADLRVHPGNALEVETVSATAGPWAVAAPEGSVAAAQALRLAMQQDPQTATRYDFAFDAPAFQPGSLPRAAFRIPADWPVTFDSLALDATVDFDRPIDRRTIEDARPQPRQIDLRRAEAIWGDVLLRGAADLEVAADGVLSGEISFQARNWRDILDLAERAEVLPAVLRPQLENILAALARGGGNENALDVTLTLSDGTVFMGFIPLGTAPRLVLR